MLPQLRLKGIQSNYFRFSYNIKTLISLIVILITLNLHDCLSGSKNFQQPEVYEDQIFSDQYIF